MKRKSKITSILKNNLKIYDFKIRDLSKLHKGHSGFVEGEETHLEITVISDDFKNKNKLERHRMLNKLLNEEFSDTLHSASYKLYTVLESEKD